MTAHQASASLQPTVVVEKLPLTPEKQVTEGHPADMASSEADVFDGIGLPNVSKEEEATLSNNDKPKMEILDTISKERVSLFKGPDGNFLKRDGPGFNPVPSRSSVSVKQSPEFQSTLNSSVNMSSQLRPLMSHEALMEISSRWLAADAKAKLEAKAKADAKAKAEAQAKAQTNVKAEVTAKVQTDAKLEGVVPMANTKSAMRTIVPRPQMGVQMEPAVTGGRAVCGPSVVQANRVQMSTVSVKSEATSAGKRWVPAPFPKDYIGGQTVKVVRNRRGEVSFVVDAAAFKHGFTSKAMAAMKQGERYAEESNRNKKFTLVVAGISQTSDKGIKQTTAVESSGDQVHDASTNVAESQRQAISTVSDQSSTTPNIESSHPESSANLCKVDLEPAVPVLEPARQDSFDDERTLSGETSIPAENSTDGKQDKDEVKVDESGAAEENDRVKDVAENSALVNGTGENSDTSTMKLGENERTSTPTRRRRKQHLTIRGTEPIPSPSKAEVVLPPPETSPPKLQESSPSPRRSIASPEPQETKPKVHLQPTQPNPLEHPQGQRRAPLRDTTSPTSSENSKRPAPSRASRPKPKKAGDGTLRMLAPKGLLSASWPRSFAASSNVPAIVPPDVGLMALDRPLIATTCPQLVPTQQPNMFVSQPGLVGSRSLRQVWSAWGGAVDVSPRNTQTQRPPPKLHISRLQPAVSSGVTHVRLQYKSGVKTARKPSAPSRRSWKVADPVSVQTNDTAVQPSESPTDVDETADALMPHEVVYLDEDFSPTKAAEKLFAALEELEAEADAEIARLSPSPPAPHDDSPPAPHDDSAIGMSSDPGDLRIEDLLVTPPPMDPILHPQSPPCLAPAPIDLRCVSPLFSATGSPPELSPVKSSASPSAAECLPSMPMLNVPSDDTERSPSPLSFPYQCMFCGARFEIPEQHLNHLVQCSAPLTECYWANMVSC